MSVFWIRAGCAVMFLSVALGAFAAHGLRARLTLDLLAVFETGVRYQALHGLALFIVAWLHSRGATGPVQAAGWSFLLGIVLFSGSLYLLSLTGTRSWGAVTPLGGLAFLLGWGFLFFARLP
jgi:uncharacterized membrane protein YgdD (TMEM256/DUF423 family)